MATQPTSNLALDSQDEKRNRERRENPVPWRERLLVTPDEAANVLSVSRSKVYEWLDSGIIPAFRIDGETSVRIRAQWLIEWVEGAQMAAQPQQD